MIDPSPRPGDIGLTTIRGPVGWLIWFLQLLNGDGAGRRRRRFQHAFTVLPGGALIEAEPGGARIRRLSEYSDRTVVYVCVPGMTDEQRAAVCEAARSTVGARYAFLVYLAMALHRFRIPAPGLQRLISASRHQICSQACDAAYLAAGIQLFQDGRWPGYATPMALWNLLGRGGE